MKTSEQTRTLYYNSQLYTNIVNQGINFQKLTFYKKSYIFMID